MNPKNLFLFLKRFCIFFHIFYTYSQLIKEIYKGKYQTRIETYKIWYGIGCAYMQTGIQNDITNAYDYMNLALQISDKLCGKDSIESGLVYLNIGKLYKMKGDLYNAKNHFRVAQDILENTKIENEEKRKNYLSEIKNEIMFC